MESCVKKILGAWPKPYEGELPSAVSSHESAWASALAMFKVCQSARLDSLCPHPALWVLCYIVRGWSVMGVPSLIALYVPSSGSWG
jgi:hypothetical protein